MVNALQLETVLFFRPMMLLLLPLLTFLLILLAKMLKLKFPSHHKTHKSSFI